MIQHPTKKRPWAEIEGRSPLAVYRWAKKEALGYSLVQKRTPQGKRLLSFAFFENTKTLTLKQSTSQRLQRHFLRCYTAFNTKFACLQPLQGLSVQEQEIWWRLNKKQEETFNTWAPDFAGEFQIELASWRLERRLLCAHHELLGLASKTKTYIALVFSFFAT